MPGPLNHLKHQRHLKHLTGSLAADGGGGGAWTPARYAGTFDGWYDASLETGSDGDPKTPIDRSSAGHNTSSGTPLKLLNATLNGMNVLYSTGGGENLQAAGTASDNKTVFIVFRATSIPQAFNFPLTLRGSSQLLAFTGVMNWYSNSAVGFVSLYSEDTNWRLIEINISNANSVTITISGATTTFTPAADIGSANLQYIFTSEAFTGFFVGQFAEYVAVLSSLDTTTQALFRTYLKNKWGV